MPKSKEGIKASVKSKSSSKNKSKKDDVQDLDVTPAWDEVSLLSEKLAWQQWAVKNTVQLLDEDFTIPFIARYRKEQTNNMEADKIRQLKEQKDDLRAVQSKIATVMQTIAWLDQLTPSLTSALKQSETLAEVEHLYAPYKPGSKRSLAQRARDVGLEPLTMTVLQKPLQADLTRAVKPQTEGLSSVSEVEKGVQHIIADLVSKDKEVMDKVRASFRSAHIVLESHKSRTAGKLDSTSSKASGAEAKKEAKFSANMEKFENYFDFTIPTKYIKAHQVLAINRGESLKVLTVKLNIPDHVKAEFCRNAERKYVHSQASGYLQKLVRDAVEDAYTRLIQPLMVRHIRSELSKQAEKESVQVFASNLKRLLLSPPVRGRVVLGLDPGFRNGCKYAIVSAIGTVLDTGIAYLHGNPSRQSQEVYKLSKALNNHRCETVALGNGQACRETETVLSEHIHKATFSPLNLSYCIVNEAGASIYSASDEAKKEMPDLDISLRGAVSIARRLQDPMAELVKIEPKHIGVGMYQHDVSETELRTALDGVVEDCVSFVGVDLNVCSQALLTRIAGLNKARAAKIIERREKEGAFINREQLCAIKGLGPISYLQCAGFVRVLPETRGSLQNSGAAAATNDDKEPSAKGRKRKTTGSKTGARGGKKAKMAASLEPNALDMTNIHPESYHVADSLIERLQLEKEDLGQDGFSSAVRRFAASQDVGRLAEEYNIGPPTMSLILEGLQQPRGHDLRDEFEKPLFKQGVTSLRDLQLGASLTGRVTNTVNFGAFVDIGVGRDALIHVSKMPRTALAGKKALELGDKVEVTVDSIDAQKGRVGLRLKRLL